MLLKEKNIVISYKNPDTDGVACSIGMATLMANADEKWEPAILGEIGKETQYVLNQANIPYPQVIESFSEVSRIVLVDTHHKSQLPDDFPSEKVVMIIDHHPNGDDIFPNAVIIDKKIGAAASIVAEKLYKADRLEPKIAFLLGCAIVSNTLNFTAPSTSDYDREIYEMINKTTIISEETIEEMFINRSAVLRENIYDALISDFKIFDTKEGKVGISQIEAYNLEAMIDIPRAVEALNEIAQEKGISYCLFNGVDIKANKSIVLAANEVSEKLLCRIYGLEKYSSPIRFDRILLRKTDFVPLLNK